MTIWGSLPCLVCLELKWSAMERKQKKECQGGGRGESAKCSSQSPEPRVSEKKKRKKKEVAQREGLCGRLWRDRGMISYWGKKIIFVIPGINRLRTLSVECQWEVQSNWHNMVTMPLTWPFWKDENVRNVYVFHLSETRFWSNELNHRISLKW